MRIISPFKDYYDSAQAYGIDPNLRYYRQPKLIEKIRLQDYFPLPSIKSRLGYWNVVLARTGLLIVCGRIYPFLLPNEIFNFDQCQDSHAQLTRTLPISRNDQRIVSDEVELPFRDQNYWLKIVNDYFDELDEVRGSQVNSAIHRYVDAPVLLTTFNQTDPWTPEAEPVQAITNPRLANFGFQSILDPFTCFQEIAQYLGNELAQPDIAPLRTGDDKNHRPSQRLRRTILPHRRPRKQENQPESQSREKEKIRIN